MFLCRSLGMKVWILPCKFTQRFRLRRHRNYESLSLPSRDVTKVKRNSVSLNVRISSLSPAYITFITFLHEKRLLWVFQLNSTSLILSSPSFFSDNFERKLLH